MKKIISGLAIVVVVVGFSVFGSQKEAKASDRTLHGVADIIAASSYLFGGGYSSNYYEPVYYQPHYYPRYGYGGHRYGGYGHHYRSYGHHYRGHH